MDSFRPALEEFEPNDVRWPAKSSDVLLHIPHASTHLPDRWRRIFLLGEEDLRFELVTMTDWHTDALFDAGADADRLVFEVSRLLVDVERFEDDTLEPMAERGMGVVYTRTHDAKPLKSEGCREELIAEFYRPHHEKMDDWVEQSLARHGRALIVDCHSYPSIPLPSDWDQLPNRPDFCIGTDLFHTPAWLVASAREAIERSGHTVEIDRPYRGTIVPMRHWQKAAAVCSIMIEINRRLYIDERTGERSDGYAEAAEAVAGVLRRILADWRRLA
jgi:N-formylglutamate deformylase